MRFNKSIIDYLNSKTYNSLSYNTKKTYRYNLLSINDTKVYGIPMARKILERIDFDVCNELYDTWEFENSTANANHLARVFSVLMNYYVDREVIPRNPMKRVKKRTSEPRSVIWIHEQVMSFLDTAFTNFDWRNIGLIVLMCYEWSQRPVDIRNLTFNNINWKDRFVTIKQTKRGATVELPITDELYPMLEQQEKDWGFQEYVVPHHKASEGAYRPLTVLQMTTLLKEVKATAGLPDNLQVGDLRKTGIVQMIEGQVDHLAIQSVTGHKNVSSLNPYNKFNLETAKSALDRRVKCH